MSDRLTSATAPNGAGLQSHGRKTREEMIAEFRSYYEHQLKQAQVALSFPDSEIVVHTFLGAWAERKKEVVL